LIDYIFYKLLHTHTEREGENSHWRQRGWEIHVFIRFMAWLSSMSLCPSVLMYVL